MPIDNAVGQPLASLHEHVKEDSQVIVQDASPRVGVKASYQAGKEDADRWTVVAACANASTYEESSRIEVAVIPKSSATGERLTAIKSGSMADAVDCSDVK